MAEAYGSRPSGVLGIEDDWAAYQLDAAAALLAGYVERARIDKRDVAALLDGRAGEPGPGRFRSPAGLVTGGLPGGKWPEELLPRSG